MNIYATLIRDSLPACAYTLYQIVYKLSSLDDHLIIVENDSQDGLTREFLEDFCYSHHPKYDVLNNIHLVSENLGWKRYGSVIDLKRATNMAIARNKYLNWVRESSLNPEKLIVFDADMQVLPKENFSKMFEGDEAAVTSNGLYWAKSHRQNPVYYDAWAYLPLNSDKIDVFFNDQGVQTHTPPPPFPEPNRVKVRSAFGGLSVYDWKQVKNCNYKPFSFGRSPCALCEHGGFSEEIRKNGGSIVIEPSYKPFVNII